MYLAIAIIVFILSFILVYATTHRKYLKKSGVETVWTAQYIRGVLATAMSITLVVMFILKAIKG
jgi:hypothetical protein